jgi:hypothetical protein
MNKNIYYLYIAPSLTILIPAPARFAYGIILLVELNFLVLSGILPQSMIKHFKVNEFSKPLYFIFLISFVIVFRQLISLYSPLISNTLYFNFYLTAIASFPMILFTDEEITEMPLKRRLTLGLKNSFKYTVFGLLYFLFRDLISFGTITLPGRHQIIEYVIFKKLFESNSFFWNSIPFGLILLAMFLALTTFIQKKFDIVRRAQV